MKKFLDVLSEEMQKAFESAGYDPQLGRVTVSNRPDLCEYQCNGAMAGAKQYHKAPLVIAGEVAEKLSGSAVFREVTAIAPGFLNLKVSESFLLEFLRGMRAEEKFGLEPPERPQMIIVDYGGANVAKPLHVGHIRSANIGESVKRICRYVGHQVLGDVHLGDFGLQMGQVIIGVQDRQPDLVYFDESYQGEYPEEPPFTLSDLEKIYPEISGKCKTDETYRARALEATAMLQNGRRGYRALWKHIMDVSIPDLKRNYGSLNVTFDLWKGESSVHDQIPEMAEKMKQDGYAYFSDGALVVDVKEETDTKEVPPCMLLKSGGAALYSSWDLATIRERMALYHPDKIIYLTDKRQDLYFEQVFRCARKTKLVEPDTELVWIGFGTMNGRDGKAFKTREGGVMRYETLVNDVKEEMYRKIREERDAKEGREMSEEEARSVASVVAVSALKYGDLSTQASKDCIFDIDRFTSFEGDTGPYILYTIVRIKSILSKYREQGGNVEDAAFCEAGSEAEKELMLALAQFNAMMQGAGEELAPHKVCGYLFDLANRFNHFYHETKILTEEDETRRAGLIALLSLSLGVLEDCIGVLGFEAPERM